MTGTAYRRSAELAGVVGPYDGYARNAEPHKRVMRKHAAANDAIKPTGTVATALAREATKQWQRGLKIGEKSGWRNAQASVLAPTGTIGLMMDCDTTGVEPDLALVKFKKLVGGGSMQIVNQTVPRALRSSATRRSRSRRSSSTSPSTATSSTRPASSPSTTRCSTARWASGRSRRWATCG